MRKIVVVPDNDETNNQGKNSCQDTAFLAKVNTLVFTTRELEILNWIAKGKSNWVIGTITGLSIATVKHEISNVFAKLGVQTRVQAVVRAVNLGLISDE